MTARGTIVGWSFDHPGHNHMRAKAERLKKGGQHPKTVDFVGLSATVLRFQVFRCRSHLRSERLRKQQAPWCAQNAPKCTKMAIFGPEFTDRDPAKILGSARHKLWRSGSRIAGRYDRR